MAEGVVALERAAQAYRPGSGARFASFAAMSIWQVVQRAVHNQSRTIRLPAHHYKGGPDCRAGGWLAGWMTGK